MTTQYLDEADQLADRIAVIDHGRVIAEGTAGELKASVGSGALHLRLKDPSRSPEAQQLLAQVLGGSVTSEDEGASLFVRLDDTSKATEALTALTQAGIELIQFSLGQPSLDEVFLALTGHPAESETDNEEKK